MESRAVPEPPRRPLPATVQHSARRLLSVQRSGGGFIPSELGAPLPVAMRRAGLSVQAVMAAGARGQTLGDVLCVGGWASLAGTTVTDTAESSMSRESVNKRVYMFTADDDVGLVIKRKVSLCETVQSLINVF